MASAVADSSAAVLSLRAAALLSRKSKRRKTKEHTNGDAAREEGEISDSEDIPIHASNTTIAKAESPSHASLLNRISDAPDDLPPPSPSPPRQDAAFQLEQSPPQRFRSGTPVLGFVPPERYPRPGLPMTQEQYDQAKDIILDLLGWGVSPEHLVSQGLSVATIYHVFTELHLRLPSNIDFSRFINGEPRPTAISQHGHDSLPARPLAAHPSLPARPGVSDDLALRIGGPADPSSLDVERQRKQELLARRAAQASRRSRVLHTEPSSSSERPTSPALEAEMARPIDVDNFLSTISPPSTSIISDSPDTFAVDAVQVSSQVVTSIPDTDQIMAPTFLRENTPQGLSSGIQRRGTKRPLAADFEESIHQASSSYPRVVRHRSSGNFSGISVRRCVLEPDESDESGDEGAVAALQISNTRPVSPALGRPVTVLSSHTPSTNTPTTSNGANVSSQLQQTEHALELLRKKILAKEQAALLKRTTSAHIQTTPTPTPEQQLSVDVKKEESHDQILLKDLETAADDEPYEQSLILDSATPHDSTDPFAMNETKGLSKDVDIGIHSLQMLASAVTADGNKYDGQLAPDDPTDQVDAEDESSSTQVQQQLAVLEDGVLDSPRSDERAATLVRTLDPRQRVCKYELPGGGVCRDTSCEDLHLYSRVSSGSFSSTVVEDWIVPTDQAIAEYLTLVISPAWLREHNVSATSITELLSQHQPTNGGTMTWEHRVTQVLSLLGPIPPPFKN